MHPTTSTTSTTVPCRPERAALVRAGSRVRADILRLRRASGRLASEVGQGTVEYVGLLLLMATLLAAVVGAAGALGGKDQIGKKVVNQIGSSIDKAGQGSQDR